jgi:hypothetical protein
LPRRAKVIQRGPPLSPRRRIGDQVVIGRGSPPTSLHDRERDARS